MSKYKIDFMLEMIERVEIIVKRHGGIAEALNDIEGEMSILMAIAQIGESLKKLPDSVLKKYELYEDKKGAYYTRNYIVHEYEGVDLAFVENIVRNYLPVLKEKLINIKEKNGF